MITPSSPAPVRLVEVHADQAGQRIDNFLISQLKGVPRSRIYRLLRKGEVRVNGGRTKADYKLAPGDQVRLPPVRVPQRPPPRVPGSNLIELVTQAFLYEDDDVLAINKPPGLAVHGGSGIDLGLIEILRHHFQSQRLELVHRLDRETSGCVLVAKRRQVLKDLQAQFREGTVHKRYQVLVAGSWPRHCNRIEAPLLKNQLAGGERMVMVSSAGKPSATEFRVLRRFQQVSLLEANLLTGRTHQIRVHTQHVGHPIVGDDKYGDRECNKLMARYGARRLFLHSAHLDFRRPGGQERLALEAPVPHDLAQVLDKLAPFAL